MKLSKSCMGSPSHGTTYMKFFLSGYCIFSSAAKVSDTIDLGLPHKEAHTESPESPESPVEIEYITRLHAVIEYTANYIYVVAVDSRSRH